MLIIKSNIQICIWTIIYENKERLIFFTNDLFCMFKVFKNLRRNPCSSLIYILIDAYHPFPQCKLCPACGWAKNYFKKRNVKIMKIVEKTLNLIKKKKQKQKKPSKTPRYRIRLVSGKGQKTEGREEVRSYTKLVPYGLWPL